MASEMTISVNAFNRLPLYLKVLRQMKADGETSVSSVSLAEAMGQNAAVVKKDLSCAIRTEGKPKIGYEIDALIDDIEHCLGYNNTKEAILVGVGKLGQALLGYHGFEDYGLNIVAGFDVNDDIVNTEINGKKVFPTGKLISMVERLNIKIGILATPQERAQIMADTLIEAGVRAIWNFTPAHIRVPDTVVLRSENMAASLAILSQQLKEILEKEAE